MLSRVFILNLVQPLKKFRIDRCLFFTILFFLKSNIKKFIYQNNLTDSAHGTF